MSTKAARAALLTAKDPYKHVKKVVSTTGRYADGGNVWDRFHKAVSYARGGRTEIDDKLLGSLKRPGSGYVPVRNKPGTVKIPGIGEVEARPIDAIEQSAAKYMKGQGRHHDNEFSPFNEEFARKVAEAFERMEHNPRDPKVKRAYDALIDETLAQYHAARDTGIDFKFIKPGEKDPYAASPSLGYADIVNKGKLHVFPTEAGFGSSDKDVRDNPLLKKVGKIGDLNNATVNDAFRIVHDLYGHFGPGNPFFRAPGEERAYRQHSQMYGPEARKAAATETRGQNSWVNYGPFGDRNRKALGADTVFADQKTGLLPDELTGPVPKADGGSIGTVPDTHPVVAQAQQILKTQLPASSFTTRVPKEREYPISHSIARGEPLNPRDPHPTDDELRAARADSRVGGDIVNKRLATIVPERERVAGGTYTPGAPGGGRWADAIVPTGQAIPTGSDPFPIDPSEYRYETGGQKLTDQPGKGFKITDDELDHLWRQSVEESSQAAKNAVDKHRVMPTFSGRDWHEAMSLPLRDHLWYELSGEKLAENLPDLTAKQHMKFLDIIGATSARAKPDENLERSLAVLSQHMRGAPIDVDLTIPSTVRQALARDNAGTSALPGNKTGHFSDTLALAGGLPTRFPISVNDVWVGKMFGVPDDVMSSNQSLHEPMAKYFNKLRDVYNERMDPPFTYQSWNFQAPAWVHLRNIESGAKQGDAYHQVWGSVINKLKDAGVPGIKGDRITKEALMDPRFADALRRTTKPFRDAPKATVEFGTTQTPVGKRAHELYHQAIERGDELSQHEYLKGLTTAMYQSARGKNRPWDALKKAVTGDVTGKSDITRIAAPTSDAPLDIGGTFEGAVSPNIRIPLKDMTDAQIAAFNAVAGKHLKQDAMAASTLHGAEQGSEPRDGHIRGHSLFVPTTDAISPTDLRAFAKEMGDQGHSMSFVRYPNGYHFDVLPRFDDTGVHGVTETQLDEVYGKTLKPRYGTAMVLPHDFKSVYTEASDYDATRKSLLKGFKDDFIQQAVAAGASKRAALAAAASEAPPKDLPRGGKEAWDVYRARHDHLAAAEKGFKALARRVIDAHAQFIGKAEKRFAKPVAPRDPDAPPFARGGAVNHAPTDAQKSAGNYAKRKMSFQGIPITIENELGSTRSGRDARGRAWSCKLPADYGYIRGTEGADGDHVDCYVGPDAGSNLVVVVNQRHLADGGFDEHKCLLGFQSERHALDCYVRAFSDGKGPDRIKSVEVMSVDAFRKWLKSGKTVKPANGRSIVDRALQLVHTR